jgi:hypothetical protein
MSAQVRTQHPLTTKARVARDMLDCIPVRAANMIRAGTYAGGALLKVDSDVSRPSFRDKCLQKGLIPNPKHSQSVGPKIFCIFVDLNLLGKPECKG